MKSLRNRLKPNYEILQKSLNIGIIGSRRRDSNKDFHLVRDKFLEIYIPGDKIVSGGCGEGGDRFAELLAHEKSLTIKNGGLILHLPDKSKLNNRLPYRVAYAKICYARNTLIARGSTVLIACVAPDRLGGTEDTIKKFLKSNPKEFLFLV